MKKLLLTIFAVFLITIFFILPRNRTWFIKKPVSYWNDFVSQTKNIDPAHRKTERYGTSYTYSLHIKAQLKSNVNSSNALILIPSTDYFKHYGLDYHVPEPIVFYYFTGLKTVWPNSKEAIKANWYATIREGKIVVDSVRNINQLKDSLASFNKFKISL